MSLTMSVNTRLTRSDEEEGNQDILKASCRWKCPLEHVEVADLIWLGKSLSFSLHLDIVFKLEHFIDIEDECIETKEGYNHPKEIPGR